MVYTRASFNGHVKSIVPDGFSQVGSESMFERIFADRKEVIYYSHSDYFPHGVYVQGVIVKTYFFKVEELLDKMFIASSVKNSYGDTGTISKSLINIEGINYKAFDIEIKDDDTFSSVASEIKKLIQKGAMPFFERYQTLQVVFEETENMPIEQMSNFIGQPLPFRRMMIKKLCNDPGYEGYYKLVTEFYGAEKSKEELSLASHLHQLLSHH